MAFLSGVLKTNSSEILFEFHDWLVLHYVKIGRQLLVSLKQFTACL